MATNLGDKSCLYPSKNHHCAPKKCCTAAGARKHHQSAKYQDVTIQQPIKLKNIKKIMEKWLSNLHTRKHQKRQKTKRKEAVDDDKPAAWKLRRPLNGYDARAPTFSYPGREWHNDQQGK